NWQPMTASRSTVGRLFASLRAGRSWAQCFSHIARKAQPRHGELLVNKRFGLVIVGLREKMALRQVVGDLNRDLVSILRPLHRRSGIQSRQIATGKPVFVEVVQVAAPGKMLVPDQSRVPHLVQTAKPGLWITQFLKGARLRSAPRSPAGRPAVAPSVLWSLLTSGCRNSIGAG